MATRVAIGYLSGAQYRSAPALMRRAMAPFAAVLQTGAIRADVREPAAAAFPLASVVRFGSRSRTVGFEQVPL
jgi:hypothetical protein